MPVPDDQRFAHVVVAARQLTGGRSDLGVRELRHPPTVDALADVAARNFRRRASTLPAFQGVGRAYSDADDAPTVARRPRHRCVGETASSARFGVRAGQTTRRNTAIGPVKRVSRNQVQAERPRDRAYPAASNAMLNQMAERVDCSGVIVPTLRHGHRRVPLPARASCRRARATRLRADFGCR
ncbi:hypothetical protein ACFPRL_32610 [Pseudoclavibacter helvolus]